MKQRGVVIVYFIFLSEGKLACNKRATKKAEEKDKGREIDTMQRKNPERMNAVKRKNFKRKQLNQDGVVC